MLDIADPTNGVSSPSNVSQRNPRRRSGAAPKGANPPAARPQFEGSPPSQVKNYVLDTNVLLHDPNAIFNFQDNQVLVPIEVIEEVDKFKRETSDLGQNARWFHADWTR